MLLSANPLSIALCVLKGKTMPKVDFEPTVIQVCRLTCHTVDGSSSGGYNKCHFCSESHTPGSGFGTDYFCDHPDAPTGSETRHGYTHPHNKVMGYVEYSNDWQPVPAWCPLRPDRAISMAIEQKKLVDRIGGENI